MTLREALTEARAKIRPYAGPDTDDALQEAVCRALAAGVDPAQPAYLLTVARRWTIDQRRHAAIRDLHLARVPRPAPAAPPDVRLDSPLARITPEFHQTILLVAQGYSCREVAAVTGVSRSTVATRTFRGRACLKN